VALAAPFFAVLHGQGFSQRYLHGSPPGKKMNQRQYISTHLYRPAIFWVDFAPLRV